MTEAQDSVTVSFEIADLPLLAIYRALPGQALRVPFWVQILYWIGFFVMGLSAMGLLVEHEPRGLLLMLAAALFGLAIWVRRRRLQAHVVATAGKTWSRHGPRTMTIDGTGIASAGAGYASSLAWSMVTDVINVGPHTVMVFSPHEFVAIPDAALPVSLTPEAFRARIADWRAKATA